MFTRDTLILTPSFVTNNDIRLHPKLPQVMVQVLVLRLAPLFAGELSKKRVDVAVETFGTEAVKFGDQLL